MNVEIGTEAAQFPEKEYINWIFVAVRTNQWKYIPREVSECMRLNKFQTSSVCNTPHCRDSRVLLIPAMLIWQTIPNRFRGILGGNSLRISLSDYAERFSQQIIFDERLSPEAVTQRDLVHNHSSDELLSREVVKQRDLLCKSLFSKNHSASHGSAEGSYCK
jgi:hypothetical protein